MYQIKQSYNDLIVDLDEKEIYLTLGQKCDLRRIYNAASAALISAVETAAGALPVDFVEKSRATIYYADGEIFADLDVHFNNAYANDADDDWNDDDWDDADWYFHIYLE